MPLTPGDKLGPYEILSRIGAGGMGEVYKARDTRLDRTVAIKVSGEKFSDRFNREARAVAALNHPNVCTLHDVGPDYLVMELVDGTPIAPVDSPRKLLDIAVQISDGLAAAHAAGIIHRDLKPDNILITREGRIKILDFGLAKAAAEDTGPGDATRTVAVNITDAGTTLGTIAYMSPEQARGQSNLTAQSDQFSLGLVLYELAAGKRAFQRNSAAETMTAIIREDPEALPLTLPAPLRWIIERLLNKEPAERYDSTRDLYRELRQLRDKLSESVSATAIQVSEATTALPASGRWPGRFVWVATLLATLLCAAGFWRLATEPPLVDPSQFSFQPFATDDVAEQDPVWSPDGKSIVYKTYTRAGWELVVKDTEGSAPLVLARSRNEMESFSWSPNGNRIYYKNGSRTAPVFSVARTGGDPIRMLQVEVSAVALSPDGRTLATIENETASGKSQKVLKFSSPPGSMGRRVALLPNGGFPNGLAWSQDSSKILIGVPREIRLFDTATTQERKLADVGLLTYVSAGWLPDHRRVMVGLAESDDSGKSSMVLLDTATGAQTRVLAGVEAALVPALSPDGKRIVYQSGGSDFDLLEIPLDGSAPRPLLATSQWEHSPAWSPVSPEFAYVSPGAIHVRGREPGSTLRTVVTAAQVGMGELVSPSFSPDGKRIAYSAGGGPKKRIWISPVGGGTPALLADFAGSGVVTAPTWSPDGRWIAFVWQQTPQSRLSLGKIRVGAAEQPILLTEQPCGFAPSWSPDGTRVLCGSSKALYTVSADGGKPEFLGKEYLAPALWSPDGRFIYAMRGSADRRQLGRLDWKSGAFQTIVDFELDGTLSGPTNPSIRFSLAPDGKSLATMIARQRGDLWILDGFQPPPSLWQRLWRR